VLNNDLNPQYVRGVLDAEGCFHISHSKYHSNRTSFRMANKNLAFLNMLKDFFQEGYVYENAHGTYKDVHEFVMQSKNQLRILLAFFEENGDPIIKQTNRPRNRNKTTTYQDWKRETISYINKNSSLSIRYSEDIKKKAIVLYTNGKTLKEISETLGPSTASIHKWVNE